MDQNRQLSGFAKYAWFALAYNVLVILWGVFLRASKSGDGCGQHWLTCHGEVIPSAPELKTIIEFSHRLTSGLAFVVVLILVIFALRKYGKSAPAAKAAIVAFIFIITEALVGAGLVLTGNTAEAVTAARPFWAIGHLLNTFILLAALTLTAWFAGGGRRPVWLGKRKPLILFGIGVAGILFVGVTGSVAALSHMLFPSQSIAEGIAKDFSGASHALLRLRVSHPIVSIMTGVYLVFLAGYIRKASALGATQKFAGWLSVLVMAQLAFGAATLLMLGPIVMQLGHLLLADAVWIVLILLAASYFSEELPAER